MTISVVQTAAINNGFSGSFGSNVTTGNSIVMAVTGYNGGSGLTITTSSPLYNGGAVTGAAKLTEVYSGDDSVAFWLLPNVASAGTSLSITATNSLTGAFVGIIAWEVSGLGASPALDKSSTGSGSGSGNQSSGASGNITNAPEFIAGVVVQDGTAGTLPSSPWTNTTLPGNGSDNSFAGYQVATSSGGSYTYNAVSGSAVWNAAVVTIAAGSTSISLADSGAGSDSGFTVAGGVPLAESGSAAESASLAGAVPLADTAAASEACAVSGAVPLADAGAGDDSGFTGVPSTSSITLTDPDATFGDDSNFVAGLLATDTGAGSDALAHGPTIGDTGSGSDSAVTVAVAVPLAETAAGDDLPWEYLSSGLPVFPYYADIPAAALTRVKVGDSFLWYAPS